MQQKKESHFANLAKIAFSDGEFDDSEKELLIKAAARLEIPPERVLEILSNLETTPFIPPKSPSLRKTALQEYVEMMEADGVVALQERIILHDVGEKLGFSTQQVETALSGDDPGTPGKADNSFENKTLVEVFLATVAVVLAIIGCVWSSGYERKIDRIATEKRTVNREIAAFIEKENDALRPLKNAQTALADSQSKLESARAKLHSVEKVGEILSEQF